MNKNKEVIMKISHMRKTFGPTVALDDVDLEVVRGEIRGLIGENGSGKSTITSIFSGMQPADSGSMTFKGENWNPKSMTWALENGVGMIVQESGTVGGITVAENMFLNNYEEFKVGKFFINNKAIIKKAQDALGESGVGGAVWGDCATIIPWNLYIAYGDKNLLLESYPMVKDYVEKLIEKDVQSGNKQIIKVGFTFGDWLAQDGVTAQSMAGGTDDVFIKTVYYYNSINIAKNIASTLGFEEDYIKYRNLEKKIYNAILDEYFAPNGKLALDTQTSYVLSLYYKIYRNKERVINDFRNRLSKDFYKMKTGFTGTPLILHALLDNGMIDDAYRILYNEKCPGWLYQVKTGATTIWERWNSLLEDGTISGIHMNSLNHYALGSVCEAIYSKIIGLKPIEAGFKKVLINPHLNYRMKKASIEYKSISGTYKVSFDIKEDYINLKVSVPNNCEARVVLYDIDRVVNSGEHEFNIKTPHQLIYPFTLDTPNLDILNNEKALSVMKKYLTQAYYMVTGENEEFKINNARFFSFLPMFGVDEESIKKYEEEIKKIKG